MARRSIMAIMFSGVLLLSACGQSDTGEAAAAPQAGPYMVASANAHATEAGLEILAAGGSAVDAAIAVQAVLGLVEPQSSGLGGGAFLLHFDKSEGRLQTFDGRETAPASVTPDLFLNEDGEPLGFLDAVVGGRSVGVPGVVAMMGLAHEEHGRLPWADLFAPALRLTEEGFEVSPRLNYLLGRLSRLETMPAARAYFYGADGAPLPVGHVLKNPAYAETLRLLAEEGPAVFYEGVVAQQIVDAATTAPVAPSGMTVNDLKAYKPVERAPVCSEYRAVTLCGMGPPSSGGVTVLQILGILENFDMGALQPNSAEALHLILEASRLAYADRNLYLADSDFVEAPVEELLNKDYLKSRAALIDRSAAAEAVKAGDPTPFIVQKDARLPVKYAPDASPELPSTSHFSIIDANGDAVSMTTTVEFAFGSHVMAGGFILNNQLTDFSFLPERDGKPVANAVAPGKRPRSSMSPTIAFDENGDVWAALGSPGGPAIIGYVAKTLIALIDWEMEMQAAIDLPNAVVPRGTPYLEKDKFSPQTIAALQALGHDIKQRELTSGLHGVRIVDGALQGGADPRREGVAKAGGF
ncbi:MAG: gamma-glutamyltransferase [Pseudomonadota bacterium]